MLTLNPSASPIQLQNFSSHSTSLQTNCNALFLTVRISSSSCARIGRQPFQYVSGASRSERPKTQEVQAEFEGTEEEYDDEDENESPSHRRFRIREGEEKDYDRDPEFAEILGSCLDDPEKAQSKVSCHC